MPTSGAQSGRDNRIPKHSTLCRLQILVEVPQKPTVLPTDEELLRLYATVHGEEAMETQRKEIISWSEEQCRQWRNGLYAQMWGLSSYLKLLKQRFTQW